MLGLRRRTVWSRSVVLAVATAMIVIVGATSLWASRGTPGTSPSHKAQTLPSAPPSNQRPAVIPEVNGQAEGQVFTGPRHRQRGVALGLFAEDVSFSYAPLLAEIAALGATHVALIVPVYQEHGGSTSLYLHTRFSPTLDAVAEAVRLARQQRLDVTLFPIVRLQSPRGPNEWRGTLAPQNVPQWFSSYGQILGSLAAVGSLTGATRLVVGSELSTLDVLTEHWQPLLDRVRAVFSGSLVYSANWDHYQDATVLDLVDEAGVTGYFSLRNPDGASDVESLTRSWRKWRAQLEAWAAPRHQPWLISELGYRSRAGATAAPWDETPGGTANPGEQARGFEAFARAFSEGSSLGGLYIWNWYGYGGDTTASYTPRGKPAAKIIKRLLSDF